MKLTNCSRTTIIEDRPLKVGEDLSEEEANVLRGYGWSANTGLGVSHEKTSASKCFALHGCCFITSTSLHNHRISSSWKLVSIATEECRKTRLETTRSHGSGYSTAE